MCKKTVGSPFSLKERRLKVKPIKANPASGLLLLYVSVIEPWSYGEENLIANIVYCQVHSLVFFFLVHSSEFCLWSAPYAIK